jgi:hypothetical protein
MTCRVINHLPLCKWKAVRLLKDETYFISKVTHYPTRTGVGLEIQTLKNYRGGKEIYYTYELTMFQLYELKGFEGRYFQGWEFNDYLTSIGK